MLKIISDNKIDLQSAYNHFDTLVGRKGRGNDFLGWLDLPMDEKKNIDSYQAVVDSWREKLVDLVVVIGIGGSYLGSKAAIEALSHSFMLNKDERVPKIVFAGNNLSQDYHAELFEMLDMYSVGVLVISKSGTTTEPAVAFRLIKNYIENRYGQEESVSRIVAVTDAKKGALKTLADKQGYKTFVIEDSIGGRFSVLSPVGLLPIALAGFDIKELLRGAEDMRAKCLVKDENNPAIQYAAYRNAQYASGKKIELFVSYLPKLHSIGEWCKQLFGESEGKEGKGIFPSSVDFTADLHSLGQYIQEGERLFFETIISIKNPQHKIVIPEDKDNLDKLNFIAGRDLDDVSKVAQMGVSIAHKDAGVDNIVVELDRLNEYSLGELFYFFEFTCGISAYILGVNPFDQPGVEAYKNNMYALLGKPGYEQLRAEIEARIK